MLRTLPLCLALITSLILTTQNNAPQSTAAPAPSFDESSYSKFDQLLAFFRDRTAKEYLIDTTKGIQESTFVSIGGIDQWITIRGADRNNPVLLFVHGGPGDATSAWSLPYFRAWEKHFPVVQWDQRGAGKTFGKSGPSIAPTMTLDRMTNDGLELTYYLRKHLDTPKIILVAHSFGTILALRMVQQKPELFLAYVGTGQVADETTNYAVAYQSLLQHAHDTHNREALDELKTVGPPSYSDYRGYEVQRKRSNRFEHADVFLPGTVTLALQSPGYTIRDLDDTLDGEVFSADQLVPQTKSAAMKDLGLHFAIPMFFFEGADDFSTPTELARKYLNTLDAPRKEFIPIPAGHFAVFTHSDDFLAQLLSHFPTTH